MSTVRWNYQSFWEYVWDPAQRWNWLVSTPQVAFSVFLLPRVGAPMFWFLVTLIVLYLALWGLMVHGYYGIVKPHQRFMREAIESLILKAIELEECQNNYSIPSPNRDICLEASIMCRRIAADMEKDIAPRRVAAE